MNKKGAIHLVIGGISLGAIIYFLIQSVIIGAITDQVLEGVLAQLGSDNVCPKEFSTEQYKVCFNANGEVIVDGLIQDTVTIQIDGTSNSCHIKTGQYDFEYSGCRLDNFKQLSAYNLLLISSKGKISLKGATIIKRIAVGSTIVKSSPKGIRWFKRLKYLTRFV